MDPSPPYAQVLVVMSALSTCDPGDVFAAIAACKKSRVRATVLGLGGEVHVCRRIAQVRMQLNRR
eukprot:7189247-Pyramimonas_sp.AAC.1